MKKIFIYGLRPGLDSLEEGRFIATISVHNGRLVIENPLTPQIAQGLLSIIEPIANGPGFRHAASAHEPGIYRKIDDPLFIDALQCSNALWSGHRYDGWAIFPMRSKITDV